MPLDRFVDSILDYFRLPEHKKSKPPGTGARVKPEQKAPKAPREPKETIVPPENAHSHIGIPPKRHPVSEPRRLDKKETHQPPSESTESKHHERQSQRTPAASPPAVTHEQDDDPIRILLVEDDPKWAQLVKAYVAAINHEKTLGVLDLVWVETLKETVEKISKRSYDLIFLDLMLPDSQGIHTLESVWERASRVQTPVVVMSNLDSGGVMDRVREVTGRDILLKKNISKKVLFGQIDFNVFED